MGTKTPPNLYPAAVFVLLAGFAGGLAFSLYRAAVHWAWARMRPHPADPHAALMLALFALMLNVVFWHRLAVAGARQFREIVRVRRVLARPLPALPAEDIPPAFRRAAKWHLVADTDRYAFTWGLFRPQIVCSTGLWEALDPVGRSAVLAHEAYHARARDPFWQVFVQMAAEAFPFFPFSSLLRRYLTLREVLADQAALTFLNNDATGLLKALLAVLSPGEGTATAQPAVSVGWAGSFDARVEFLAHGTVPSLWDHPTMARLAGPSLAFCLTVAPGLLTWCR